MSFIRSHDASIYYEEHGSGEPLILLPGLLGTIESTWRRFLPDFASRFHTIVMDLRGHGRTNNPSGVLHLDMLSSDLGVLIDTLGLGRVMVCGYSLGGYIGLHYAMHHPGQVARLVMHATKFFWTGEDALSLQHDLDPETVQQRSPHTAERLRQAHTPGNGADGWIALSRAGIGLIGTLPAHGLTQDMLALADLPVLVTTGASDATVTVEEAGRLAQLLPRGSVRIIPEASHQIATMPAQNFTREVLPFLAQPE
jgi:pimeloyl-ACP methyl ester carboxylesterase